MSNDTYPNAGRPSGYVDDQGRPIGEDIINKIAVLTTDVQVRLGLKLDELQANLDNQAKIRRRQFDELTAHGDARHVALTKEIDLLLRLVQEGQAEAKKLATALDALIAQVSDMDERMGDMDAVYHERIKALETWIAGQPTPDESRRLIAMLMQQQQDMERLSAHLFPPDEGDVLESFRRSRNLSIEERAALRADMEASKLDRQALHDHIEATRLDMAEMREYISRAEPMLRALYAALQTRTMVEDAGSEQAAGDVAG